MAKKLRFAALIRVSTEKQAEQGESLRTQRASNERSVNSLGGTIVEWYGGHEHATPGYEKKEIDRLVSDAAKGKFDAVIIYHAFRWSRDNAKSKEGLEAFRRNNIRFFVGTFEYDLFNPQHKFYLGVAAEIGELNASTQNQQSLENRISRAKRGVPTSGKLPFGRTFNRKTETWAVDPEKQAMVVDCAKRYLAGESISNLAKEYGINGKSLHTTLMHRCGDKWTVEFHSDALNIHESVTMTVPRLLPEKTIKAMRHQAEANTTYQRNQPKHKYLFGRMVFCAHCGSSMQVQNNSNGHRYYRHSPRKKCTRKGFKPWVNAVELENVVIRHLFECFGNPKAVEKAINAATPNLEQVAELQQRRDRIQATLVKLKAGKDRIIKCIRNGTISEDEADKELKEIRFKEEQHQKQLRQITDELENLPAPEAVKAIARRVSKRFLDYSDARLILKVQEINEALDKMTWEEMRALAEMVFSGKTADGKRMGVHIEWIDGQQKRRKKEWKYTVRGHLIHADGYLPMSKARMDAYFQFGVPHKQNELVSQCASYSPTPTLPARRFAGRFLPPGA